MNHSTSTDLFGSEYAQIQRNRQVAIKALAAMPNKPIRKMGPADYAPKNIKPLPSYEETKHDQSKADRKLLAARCVKLLHTNGAQTTAQLARELKVGSRLIACALAEVTGILRETQVAKYVGQGVHRSRETLWAMPIRH